MKLYILEAKFHNFIGRLQELFWHLIYWVPTDMVINERTKYGGWRKIREQYKEFYK